MEKTRKTLDNIYSILENQERELFYEFHKDNKRRTSIIQEAQAKIAALKIIGEDLSEDIILLGDTVSLELDYGDNDVVIETKNLVISAEKTSELGLYSNVGNAIFAQKIGETIVAELNNGNTVSIKILGKNIEKEDEKTYIKEPMNEATK